MNAEKEKSVPAERISQDARCEATPTVTPSTEVWVCGLDGRITIHPTIPAPAESAEVAAQADKRPHWLRTLRRDGKPRWQTNGRSAAAQAERNVSNPGVTNSAPILDREAVYNLLLLVVAMVWVFAS
jgi:hypothetical protein